MDETRGRLIAINHVELEAAPGLEPALRWFYGDWLGLAERRVGHGDDPASSTLTFTSDRLELRITIRAHPEVEPVRRRLQIEVPSLEEAAEALEDRAYPHEWTHGLSATDRSLAVHDPAGHRVVIRRHWPPSPI